MLEGFGCGEVIGVFDEQKDAADFVKAGDGAARDDGELVRESGDRNAAEVGRTGGELCCADGWGGVMHIVARTKRGGRWLMFEAVKQRSRI